MLKTKNNRKKQSINHLNTIMVNKITRMCPASKKSNRIQLIISIEGTIINSSILTIYR